jgi:hypothetical protein
MKLQKDLREFIALLNSHGVEYLVVGAHCMAFHGIPRFTGDIDFFVKVSPENATHLMEVIQAFGFGSTGLQQKDFLIPDQIIQLGMVPHRIDLITGINGVDFDHAWAERVSGELDELPAYFLSRELLIRNKLAAGRDQDLADVQRLRGL